MTSDAVFVDLLEARTFNMLTADPQRLGNLIGDSFDLAKAVIFGLLPSLYDPRKNVPPDEYLQDFRKRNDELPSMVRSMWATAAPPRSPPCDGVIWVVDFGAVRP